MFKEIETPDAFCKSFGVDAEAHLITMMTKLIRDEIAQEIQRTRKKWGILFPLVVFLLNAKEAANYLLRAFLHALIG